MLILISMINKTLLLFIFLLAGLFANGQEYIVFEQQNSLNHKAVAEELSLSQNDVVIKSGDTTVQIFNLFYSSSAILYKWSKVSQSLAKFEDLKLPAINNILLTAVPLIKPNEQLTLKKLTQKEFSALKIATDSSLIKDALPDLVTLLSGKWYNPPSLKTWQYGLVIKNNGEYYQVQQKVLVTKYTIAYTDAYFPDQFLRGLLVYTDVPLSSTSKQIIKPYRYAEIQKILAQMKSTQLTVDVYDKTYISSVSNISGLKTPVFNYWEFPYYNGDVQSIQLNPSRIAQYHPGLGSFAYLKDIGIINCSLDYHFKKKIAYDQSLNFKIVAINSLPLNKFVALYNKQKVKK